MATVIGDGSFVMDRGMDLMVTMAKSDGVVEEAEIHPPPPCWAHRYFRFSYCGGRRLVS